MLCICVRDVYRMSFGSHNRISPVSFRTRTQTHTNTHTLFLTLSLFAKSACEQREKHIRRMEMHTAANKSNQIILFLTTYENI